MMWNADLTLHVVRLETAERLRSAEQRRLLRTVLPRAERREERPA